MSFEKDFSSRIEEALNRDPSQENIRLILALEGDRLKEEDFIDLYGPKAVEDDKKIVEGIKRGIKRRQLSLPTEDLKRELEIRQKSEALEAIVVYQGELNNWFGPNSLITKTSEYDDLLNGVDLVLEFDLEDPSSLGLEKKIHRIALAVDVTSSKDSDVVAKKIDSCFEKVMGKENCRVKYFASQVEDFKGELNQVIPVVIGLETRKVDLLIKSVGFLIRLDKGWVKPSPLSQQLAREIRKALETHPAQMIFLKEIEDQLGFYYQFLKSQEKPEPKTSKLKNDVKALLAITKEVISQKRKEGLELVEPEKDLVYFKINREVNFLKKKYLK